MSQARHILITGGGMVGAYTARALIERGARVTILDRSVPVRYLASVLGDREYETVEVDLTDVEATERALESLPRIDGIVHTAALVAARAQRDLLETVEVNVSAALRLARWAAEHGVGRFVALGSWSVYSETQTGPIVRDSPLETQFTSYYVAAKLAMEHLLSALAHATGLEVVVLRPTVIYGYGPNLGGSVGSAVIEAQVLRGIAGRPMVLPSNIISRTELVYVEDVAAFAAAALDVPLTDSPFEWLTVGSEQTTTLEELADTLRELLPGVPVHIEEGAASSVIPPRQDQPTDVSATVSRLGVTMPLARTDGFRRFIEVLRDSAGEGLS